MFKARVYNHVTKTEMIVSLPNNDAYWRLQEVFHFSGSDVEVTEYIPMLGSMRMPHEFRAMIAAEVKRTGNKIAAIKMLRQMTASGLKEAKDALDACVAEFAE